MKKVIALVLMSGMLVGCGSVGKSAAMSLPLVPELSTQEVIDYYKTALDFDTIATKTTEVNEVSYQTYPVSGEREEELKGLVEDVERLLSQSSYTFDPENVRLLDESTFNYIKGYLNDRKLQGREVISVSEALGYYFVDVEYKIANGALGEIKGAASLIGLHGAFKRSYTGIDSLDTIHINKIVERMNRYWEDKKVSDRLEYISGESRLRMLGSGEVPVVVTPPPTVEGEEPVEGEEEGTEGDVEGEEEGTEGDVEGSEEETEEDTTEEVETPVEPVSDIVVSNRNIGVNIRELNKYAGSSASTSAYMPALNTIFNLPSEDGLNGVGIYPQGGKGMKDFGFNRNEVTGKMVLRFVFKQEVNSPKELKGMNVYPVFYDIETGISTDQESVVVPEFIMTELEKTIERSDRAIVNNDIPALMSGTLYQDMGIAILHGYNGRYANILRNMSTIRRIMARDVGKGTYLLEVETIRQEGSKGVDTYGTYRDKNYVSVQQINEDFVITDVVTMQRRMTTEPSIKPDSTVSKRLIALNLSGEVEEGYKEGVVKLLNEHYRAGSLRVLRGPKDLGNGETLEKGMYDVFNGDVALLSTDKLEYMNSTLRNILIKNGSDVSATYDGLVTDWVGGSENQIELTTEEIVVYNGKDTGTYMEVYYLMSRMTGEWRIDDMKIIVQEEKTGAELEAIQSRITSN